MKKKLVLRDENSGMYFTNNYRKFWSKDISNAYFYDENDNMGVILELLINDEWYNILADIFYVEIVTIYCR